MGFKLNIHESGGICKPYSVDQGLSRLSHPHSEPSSRDLDQRPHPLQLVSPVSMEQLDLI